MSGWRECVPSSTGEKEDTLTCQTWEMCWSGALDHEVSDVGWNRCACMHCGITCTGPTLGSTHVAGMAHDRNAGVGMGWTHLQEPRGQRIQHHSYSRGCTDGCAQPTEISERKRPPERAPIFFPFSRENGPRGTSWPEGPSAEILVSSALPG